MSQLKQLEKRALELFEQALDLPEDERSNWLLSQCQGDENLLSRVHQLLSADSAQSSPLYTGQAILNVSEQEQAPKRVGAYTITGLIGKGGMGAVYKGTRDTGDFQHEVAIKLVRSQIKSSNAIYKFTQERQTLAQLSHPNIARLYDGGELEDNRPYLIMEWVDGFPINQYVKKYDLDLEKRLALFIDTCNAVNYAHQQLIVHRDISPNNVLVTKNTEVKLIDFGISKIQSDLESSHEKTEKRDSSHTPGFGAPERIDGSPDSTLSDIYSLGKLLLAIFEDFELPEELLAIALRASQHKPEDRYASVNDLIEDIQRYQSRFPVYAFKGGRFYVFKKFFSRNIALVSISSIAVCAVIVGFVVASVQYQRAESNFQNALSRFEQVRELAKFQLFDLYDDLSQVAGNTEIRAKLAERSHQYLDKLLSSEFASNETILETAQGYIRLARIYGVPAEPNLGNAKVARESLAKAQSLLERIEDQQSSRWQITQVQQLAAQAMISIHEESDIPTAQSYIDKANALLNSVADQDRDIAWYLAHRQLLYTIINKADVAGDTAALRQFSQESVDIIEQWPETLKLSYFSGLDIASQYYWKGLADYIDGNSSEATENFKLGHEKFVKLREQHNNQPMVLYNMAWNNYIGYASAANLGNTELSIEFLQNAEEAAQQLSKVQEGDASIIRLLMQLREAQSQLLATMGRFDEAIVMQKQLVNDQKAMAEAKPETSQFETWAFSNIILAYMYYDHNQRDKACNALEHAQEILAPFAEKQQLASYMYNAATRIGSRIEQCKNGEALDSQNSLFE